MDEFYSSREAKYLADSQCREECAPELAVVAISRNQEWNIARLIESIQDGTSCVPSREIVLVDSASTDRTLGIARRYPIGILRLRPDQLLTPAAGRYVGYKHTSGGLVLFLDGDMELCNGWLEKAVAVMESAPGVAVVTGQVIDVPETTRASNRMTVEPSAFEDLVMEVRHCGGAAMYRRSVLEQVGTFNPYLRSEEEPELCLRIRHAGYRVVRLEYPIAYHYSSPRGALRTLLGRCRRNLYLGHGQIIRHHLGSELLRLYLRERGYVLFPSVGLLGGLISVSWSLVSGRWVWFGLWAAVVVAIIVADACRKRSLYRAIFSLVRRLMIVAGTLRGILLVPLDPDGYSGRVDVIRRVAGLP